jgi:hypothetical protein
MTNVSELMHGRTPAEKAQVASRARRCTAIALIVCTGVLHAPPALAGFAVGSFTKTTAVAPASQTIAHGLGETPKALILWTDGKTSIHFIAIGGADVSAKVVEWSMPTSTGNETVGGVGFQPDVVIHVHAAGVTAALPISQGSAAIGLGAMTDSQNSIDSSNSSRPLARKTLTIVQWWQTVIAEADLSWWEATNFTLNWTTNSSTPAASISISSALPVQH